MATCTWANAASEYDIVNIKFTNFVFTKILHNKQKISCLTDREQMKKCKYFCLQIHSSLLLH